MYLMSNWPYNDQPRFLKFYYMAGVGYHLSDTINLFLKEAQSDFFEMLLHHYLTLLLIVGSYTTSSWSLGIIVMIQMDCGEIFVGFLRCFNDIWPTWIIIPLFLALNYFWIYFRIFVFTVEIIGTFRWRGIFDNTTYFLPVMQLLCFILLFLNCYWQILFFRIGYRLIFKGDAKDIQNPVEDLHKNEKKEIKL